MRIVHDSPDLLSVTEGAVGIRITGGVLAVIGAVLLVVGSRTGSVVATLGGIVALAVGVMLVVLPLLGALVVIGGCAAGVSALRAKDTRR